MRDAMSTPAVGPRRTRPWGAVAALFGLGVGAAAEPPVPDPLRPAPHGVLDLGTAGFAAGRLMPAAAEAGGRDTLFWESPLFAEPLEFRLDQVRAIRFPSPPAPPAPPSRRIHLRGGDLISGRVLALDEATLTLSVGDQPATLLSIDRAEIESIARAGAGGASFDGPGGLSGWRQSPPGTWREEAGRLLGTVAGSAIARDLSAPSRCRLDLVLSWRRRPEFRIALGAADPDAPDRFWLEAVDVDGSPRLMLVRRDARRAVLEPLAVDLVGAESLHIVLFVDRAAGRLAAIVPTIGREPLADIALGPEPVEVDWGSLRLALHAGDICLERVQVTAWRADEPALVESGGGVVVTSRDRLGDAVIESFTPPAGDPQTAGGTWQVRREGEIFSLADEEVLEVRFPAAPAANDEEPPLRVVLAGGDRLAGRLAAVLDDAIVLERRGFAEPVPLPFDGLVVMQSGQVAEPTELPQRVGTLTAEGSSLRGCLADLPARDADPAGDVDPAREVAAPGRVGWLASGAVRGVGFASPAAGPPAATIDYLAPDARLVADEGWVGGIGGVVNQDQEGRMVVAMLTEDGAAARDGRLLPGDRLVAVRCGPAAPFVPTVGLETEAVMNLLRGRVGTPVGLRVVSAAGPPREIELVRGPIGAFGPEVLRTALETHARHAAAAMVEAGDFPAVAFLASGDVVRCRVAEIDIDGATLTTAVAEEQDRSCTVPAARMRAIELVPTAPSRVLDAVRVERLLTVPRMQRDRPPSHLLRLLDGDYLRGRIDRLDDAVARIEILGTLQEVPRAAVARVIWLRAAETEADEPPGGGPGLAVRAEWGDGRRLSFAALALDEDRLRGRSEPLGSVTVDLAEVDRLLLGASAAAIPSPRPYDRWQLRPAPLPRALRVTPSP